jgi:signal transduction histidine kinase/CheY-like chemotaxis protein
VLSAPDVPEQLLRAMEELGRDSPDAIVDALKLLLEHGLLTRKEGQWRAAEVGVLRTALLTTARTRDRVTGHMTPRKLVEQAELDAANGAVLDAYRASVRATTLLRDGRKVGTDTLLRLAEVWMELGNSDACEEVLAERSASGNSVSRLTLCARARIARGDILALSEIATQLGRVAGEPSANVARARLEAMRLLHEGETRRAASRLLEARKSRRSVGIELALEFRITWANVLRLSGKAGASVRVLGSVCRTAENVGAIRLAIACQLNVLLAERDLPAAVTAAKWEALQATASAWGFSAQAGYAAAMAARTWSATDEIGRAVAVLSQWESYAAGRTLRGGRTSELLLCARLTVLDRKEDIRGVLSTDSVAASEARVRLAMVQNEFADEHSLEASRALVGSRERSVRLARISLRIARGQRVSERAVPGLLSAIEHEFVVGTGLPMHCVRAIVRSVPDLKPWASAISRQLDTDTTRDFATGAAALIVAWRGLRIDGVPAASFPTDPRRRTPGVREWEWRLAQAWAAAESPEAETRWEEYLDGSYTALLTLGESLPSECQTGYVRRVTLGQPSGCLRSAPCPAWVWSLDAWRRHAAVSFKSVRAAALEAGYKRVLASALQLRSSSSVDEVLAAAVRGVIEVCHAERAVALFDLGGDGVRAKVATPAGVKDLPPGEAEISHSVLARVRDAGGAVIIDDAAAEGSLGDRPSVRRFGLRSVLVCPLRTPSRYLGYLYVEDRSRPRSFSVRDIELLEGFASQAALALENAALVEDLRTSYRDLSQARSEAVRAENLRSLGRLATEVAHDLNNLLTAVLGEAQILLLDTRFRDAYNSLRVIERAAQDGAECIRRIQESTRVRHHAEFEEIEVVALLREVLEFTRVRCAPKPGRPDTAIGVTLEGSRRAIVRGLPSELREVFTNLIVNAVEAMATGGRLTVRVHDARDRVAIDVRDTGSGIPPDVLRRLFEPFFTTKGERGNGLGLSIAQGVVRRHGGEIQVESELGLGTVMRVLLPRVRSELSLEEGPSVESPLVLLHERQRFLIVDDDPSVLRVLGQLLEQAGADVELAVGGHAAMARLSDATPAYDCVVTDLYMPQMSGLDVADFVQKASPGTRVVVMSGCSTTLESEATRDRGITQVIRKPFSVDTVRRLVAAAQRP